MSLTGFLSNSLERPIRTQICEYLLHHRAILVEHGFIKRMFCLTNFLFLLGEPTRNLEEDHWVDICCTDFYKAFVSVDHNHLYQTKKPLGISKSPIALINSFFWRRGLNIRVGRDVKVYANKQIEWTQMSLLRHTRLLIFINHFAWSMRNSWSLLADCASGADLHLEEGIEATESWSRNLNLPLNLVKCQRLTSAGEQRGNEMDDIQAVYEAEARVYPFCLVLNPPDGEQAR